MPQAFASNLRAQHRETPNFHPKIVKSYGHLEIQKGP